jgi:hypothetical protein
MRRSHFTLGAILATAAMAAAAQAAPRKGYIIELANAPVAA